MRLLKSLGLKFAGTALLFSCVVSLGTCLVLLVSSCIGYLPYSDRPGPGWWGSPHWPSWAEITTYFGFAPWFAYFCLYFGLGLFGLSLVLGVSSTARWLIRIIGGLIAGLAAGLAVLGAGWYLALASIGPDAAALIGLLYGVFLFPRFIHARPRPIPIWARAGAVTCATALFLYWIVSPLIPMKPVASVSYDLVRVTPGDKPVGATSFLGKGISNELTSMSLRGEVHGGIGGGASSSPDTPEIDVEFVALEPITKEASLSIPETGNVVYVLKDGTWTAHPSFSKKDRRTFTIRPGMNPQFDGGQIKLGDEKDFHTFTWYPTIPRGQ